MPTYREVFATVEKLPDLLYNHRLAAGVTLSELSAQVGISISTLSMFERRKQSVQYITMITILEWLARQPPPSSETSYVRPATYTRLGMEITKPRATVRVHPSRAIRDEGGRFVVGHTRA